MLIKLRVIKRKALADSLFFAESACKPACFTLMFGLDWLSILYEQIDGLIRQIGNVNLFKY